MVYETITKEYRENITPKEDRNKLPRDRLSSISLYLSEVGPPKIPSRKEENNLFHQLAQSRTNFFEYLCRYAKKELFGEIERIIANPDEDFSLAGLDTKSENEKYKLIANYYCNMKLLDKRIDEIIRRREDEQIGRKEDERIEAQNKPEDKISDEEKQKRAKRVYAEMAGYLEKMHIINSYYERIVENYKKNHRTECCKEGKIDEKAGELNVLLKNYMSSWENIIKQYLGYVIYFARRYENNGFANPRKLEITDLIQEGNIGLMKAIERFNGSLGVKFSVYAGIIIDGEIRREIDNKSRLIRTPPGFNKLCREYKRAREGCKKELGREPEKEEVYKKMGIDDEQILFLESRINLMYILELDKSVGDNRKCSIMEIISNNEQSSLDILENISEENDLRKAVNRALKQLGEREKRLISLHWGLDGEPMIVEDVAKELGGISKQRVHQLQQKAFRKITPLLAKYRYSG
ncbi:sigma-70 family RNA polymerase sigma factor [Candidatus Woesearchaeota archaeon]|nr:sigma-70 family RNA polymerase sigma factor [Candidatus Woesearchaeota archaeon]